MPTWVMVVLSAYGVMSFITDLAMWRDKRAAIAGGHRPDRTPEASLHTLELLGGWPGTLAAQRLLRHKNRKRPYIAMLWFIILLHVVCWGFVTYWLWS